MLDNEYVVKGEEDFPLITLGFMYMGLAVALLWWAFIAIFAIMMWDPINPAGSLLLSIAVGLVSCIVLAIVLFALAALSASSKDHFRNRDHSYKSDQEDDA